MSFSAKALSLQPALVLSLACLLLVAAASVAFPLEAEDGAPASSPSLVIRSPWQLIRLPLKTASSAESIGAPSSGCLKGAVSLPPDGPGYAMTRLTRGRFYGHPDLIQFIKEYGTALTAQGVGPVLVGDLSQPRGGPAFPEHSSHQTGLDADFFFMIPTADRLPLTLEDRETLGELSMVQSDGRTPDPSLFGSAQLLLLETAARNPRVDRIFVHAALKLKLCETYSEEAWMGKLRPWWGHEDHFHVRLRCPGDSPQCVDVAPVPAGGSCDATLSWWVSDEALQMAAKRREAAAEARKAPEKHVDPSLPAACEEVRTSP